MITGHFPGIPPEWCAGAGFAEVCAAISEGFCPWLDGHGPAPLDRAGYCRACRTTWVLENVNGTLGFAARWAPGVTALADQ